MRTLSVLMVSLLVGAIPSRADTKFLGKFGLWEAHQSIGSSGEMMCYVTSLPTRSLGRLKRSEAMLRIAHIPRRRIFGHVQVKVGVALKSGVPLELPVGPSVFKL
jgi:hypothetical protein